MRYFNRLGKSRENLIRRVHILVVLSLTYSLFVTERVISFDNPIYFVRNIFVYNSFIIE